MKHAAFAADAWAAAVLADARLSPLARRCALAIRDAIAEQPGREAKLSHSAIAARVGRATAHSISRIAGELEDAGFIERARDGCGRAAVTLYRIPAAWPVLS